MTLQELGEEKYVALATFKKNGDVVSTPIWILGDDGALYAVTGANSWKVKRIRNNPRVRVAKSDSRGNPQSEWLDARAHIITDEQTVRSWVARVSAKYGLFGRLMLLRMRFRGVSERAVIVVGPNSGPGP